MRRIIIYFNLLLLYCTVNSYAQIFENSAIKFGGVLAFQVGHQAPRFGISFGISKDIFSWDNFTISSELSYIQKGYSSDLNIPTNESYQIRSNNKLEYLSLIVYGRMRIGGAISNTNTYLICGLTNNYFLDSRYGRENYKKSTIGLLAGIGGEINISAPFKIIIEFVINNDLSRATKTITRELRNTTLELKSGIKF